MAAATEILSSRFFLLFTIAAGSCLSWHIKTASVIIINYALSAFCTWLWLEVPLLLAAHLKCIDLALSLCGP